MLVIVRTLTCSSICYSMNIFPKTHSHIRILFFVLYKNTFSSTSAMTVNMSFRWIHIEIIGFEFEKCASKVDLPIHFAQLLQTLFLSLSLYTYFLTVRRTMSLPESCFPLIEINMELLLILNVVLISWSDGFEHLPFEFVCTKFHGHSKGCQFSDAIWTSHYNCDTYIYINSFMSMVELWQR